MADHSVGARDESNGSEASEALMLCFDNALPEKPCFFVDLGLCLVLPTRFCVPECLSGIFHSRESVLFSVSPFASKEKARGSRSPKERAYSVLKFRLESILENV